MNNFHNSTLNFNAFMSRKIREAKSQNKSISDVDFKSSLDTYNLILQKRTSVKNDVFQVLRVVFDSIIGKQRLLTETLVLHISSTNYNSALFQKTLLDIKTGNKPTVLFIDLILTNGKQHHQNLLIVDKTGTNVFKVYKLDPLQQEGLNNTVDAILRQRIDSVSGFSYIGDVARHVYCPHLFTLQRGLGHNYCLAYTLFLVYMLAKKSSLSLLTNNFRKTNKTMY